MAKRASETKVEEATKEVIKEIPPEDLAQFVIVCKVEKDGEPVNFLNLFAKNTTEAFIKVTRAQDYIEPGYSLTIVGTYKRVNLEVIAV